MICNRISYVPHLLLHLLSHHHCLPGTQGKVELQYHCILFYSVSLPLQQGPDRREPVCIELAAPVVHESCHHTVGRLVEHIPRAISQVQLHRYLPSALSCPNVLVEDLDLSTGVLLDSEEGVLHGDYALCLRGDLESVLAPLEQVVEGHKEDVRNSPWRIELCNGSKLVWVHPVLRDINVANILGVISTVDLHHVKTVWEEDHGLDVAPEGFPEVPHREAHSKVGSDEFRLHSLGNCLHGSDCFPLIKLTSILHLERELKSRRAVVEHLLGLGTWIGHLGYAFDEACDAS